MAATAAAARHSAAGTAAKGATATVPRRNRFADLQETVPHTDLPQPTPRQQSAQPAVPLQQSPAGEPAVLYSAPNESARQCTVRVLVLHLGLEPLSCICTSTAIC